MPEEKNLSCSFLLRIWLEPDDQGFFRYSLEDTRTGKRQGFATIESLCAFLIRFTVQDRCQPQAGNHEA